MIRSMTGYGRARETVNGRDITVEVRSVNNRYLDCAVKMPRAYLFAEDAVKSLIQRAAARGKVDVFISVDAAGANEIVVSVDQPLAAAYLEAVRSIGGALGLDAGVSALQIARLPDVLTLSKAEEDVESLTGDLCAVLEEALAAYTRMRETEGARLAADILGRLDTIEALVAKVEVRSPQTVAEYRAKLLERMQEVLESASIDESRILTEAALFADKVAVDEETVRLRSHLGQLREMLQSSGSIGRKLDFLIQEVNRECNTIGSKASDIEIARYVVDLKAEVEKIREQVQNIE